MTGFEYHMPQIAMEILIVMFLFFFKHMIADFYLQTSYQYSNKGKYLHPGGLIHSGIHILGSAPIILYVLPTSQAKIIYMLLIGEFVIHYHVDWIKERLAKVYQWTPQQTVFWIAIGTDQFIHYLTYLFIIGVLISV